MTDEKWQQIKGLVKDKFKVLDERTEDLPEDGPPGTVEIIEFIGPLGKMKLERTDSPLVIDKKTIGSRRIGSETKVEYVYSDTERVHKFRAYRWNEDDGAWVEMMQMRDNFVI
jgi:hypothetical protein